jgi:hypothetical protein
MVAAYGFGVLAPTLAFARADSASVLHVLGEAHGWMLVLHFHDGDDDHHDHPAKPGSSHHCCGFVSLAGLEPGSTPSVQPPERITTLLTLHQQWLLGRGAARLERPPNHA